MRSGTRIAAPALLLALLMTGCRHKQPKTVIPPQATAPSRPPAQMAEMIPPTPTVPVDSHPPTIMLDTATPPEPAPESRERPRHRVARHRSRTGEESTSAEKSKLHQPAAQTNPEIASGQPTGDSPIGQLSTAGGAANSADRTAITNQINATESTLNGLHHELSSDDQKTVAQIRTFIAKAREALKTNDLDGARTLSTKAHLLLQELLKQ